MGHSSRQGVESVGPAVPTAAAASVPTEVDVLIVGAGISGINAAYRVQNDTKRSYAIIEMRHDLGGTWSLFQYPGIRSDSDMYTLGFPFAPWKNAQAVADGPAIYRYVNDTARQFGIYDKIHFDSKAAGASWSSVEGKWTVQVEATSGQASKTVKCNYLYWCSGYYDYVNEHKADIPGLHTEFAGQVVHPQFWPKDLDWANKRVVVIGSGATAVTLLPALADNASHVTMLQRSPSYFVALPRADPIATVIKFLFPEKVAHTMLRYIWAIKYFSFYKMCRTFPRFMRSTLRLLTRWHLDKRTPLDPHFNPSYKPWDQRICFVPDGDMFTAIRSGKASVVTDTIDTVTKNGIKLNSGKEIAADIIIPATGLRVQLFGGAELEVDGKKIHAGEKFIYKGFMLQDVPNMCISFGYTIISWSLGSDVTAQHVCRLLNKLTFTGMDYVVPQAPPGEKIEPCALLNLNSGYLQRAESYMPKQGSKGPWYMRNNWFKDRREVQKDTLDDCLVYGKASKTLK
ncbi:FAD/NAD(P)-binding domain-containing protein [Tilletiaria anomala UBC 951]|uniref:FAD/NAD(P)-binding domain-containing protein n=1 Tax=Tilletiaria anomala (strain ATCC 24038 / CBS 436.72 / UBC 951) TaxID=1037660 RepID=A0A066VSL1_TILAU|nr:FAD/NAD(P)-binding domain-containing protein [Tilletiaria anomala UBC 951]KDN41789.1 FAD/NAD(P)-binding domain-containing protein [Tilletiaria anomala UBC 951]